MHQAGPPCQPSVQNGTKACKGGGTTKKQAAAERPCGLLAVPPPLHFLAHSSRMASMGLGMPCEQWPVPSE